MQLFEQYHNSGAVHENDYQMIMDSYNQLRQVYAENPDYQPEEEEEVN